MNLINPIPIPSATGRHRRQIRLKKGKHLNISSIRSKRKSKNVFDEIEFDLRHSHNNITKAYLHPLLDSDNCCGSSSEEEIESDSYSYIDNSFDEETSCSESYNSVFTSRSGSLSSSAHSLLSNSRKKSSTELGLSTINIQNSRRGKDLKSEISSSLTKLLNRHDDTKVDHLNQKRSSITQLTNKLIDFKFFIAKTTTSLVTSERCPSPAITEKLVFDTKRVDEPLRMHGVNYTTSMNNVKELETFNVISPEPDLQFQKFTIYRPRVRETRAGSSFLRLYALDYSARISGLLPHSHSSEEVNHLINIRWGMKKFHERHDCIRISALSRDKLWNNIALPPREDAAPCGFISHDKYIHVGRQEGKSYESLVRCNGSSLPWSTEDLTKQCFTPLGVLEQGKHCENGPSPSSGITKCQFTVKGWANPRWVNY